MSYKYVRGLGEDDYVHFWFRNPLTGKYVNFMVPDRMIQYGMKNTDNFCEVIEQILKKIEEERYFEQRKTTLPRD